MLHFYRTLTSLIIYLCFSVQAQATPAITPSCPSGDTQELGLNLTTYNTSGYNTYPSNHAQYDSLISSYAIPSKEFGTSKVPYINGSGNPYGPDTNYLSIFSGYIEAPSTGIYGIGIDGDDAIEVIIDGITITGWYGGHGKAGSAQYKVDISLDAGYHDIVFRHQERGGDDSYYLYWKKPSDSTYAIVPPANLSNCLAPLVLQAAVTPTCGFPSAKLELSTYDTTGYNTHPNNHSQYDSLVATYAIPAKIFGSGLVSTINGSGNPYGTNDKYLSLFKGYLKTPADGQYFIGVDGDDAIEVIIDGQVVSSWYGGHGKLNSPQDIAIVNLAAGYHDIEFRQEEYYGGDNYYLYWKKPGDSSFSIISAPNLYHCPYDANISLAKTSKTIFDPVNGAANPKAIPGAVVEYTLTAINTGSAPADDNIIADSLDTLITTQQSAIWASGFITIKTPSLYGGAKTTLSDAPDGDEGLFIDTAGNRLLTVNCGTLSTNQNCVVTYRVIIN